MPIGSGPLEGGTGAGGPDGGGVGLCHPGHLLHRPAEARGRGGPKHGRHITNSRQGSGKRRDKALSSSRSCKRLDHRTGFVILWFSERSTTSVPRARKSVPSLPEASETVKAERGGSSCRGRWRASTRGRDARCNGSGSFRLGGPTRIGTPVSAAAIICTNRRCSGPWPRRCGRAGSRSGRRATRCGTRSPRTCWRVARTSGRCRNYSVIATSRPPCCTRMCSTGAGSASGVLRTVQDWGT